MLLCGTQYHTNILDNVQNHADCDFRLSDVPPSLTVIFKFTPHFFCHQNTNLVTQMLTRLPAEICGAQPLCQCAEALHASLLLTRSPSGETVASVTVSNNRPFLRICWSYCFQSFHQALWLSVEVGELGDFNSFFGALLQVQANRMALSNEASNRPSLPRSHILTRSSSTKSGLCFTLITCCFKCRFNLTKDKTTWLEAGSSTCHLERLEVV